MKVIKTLPHCGQLSKLAGSAVETAASATLRDAQLCREAASAISSSCGGTQAANLCTQVQHACRICSCLTPAANLMTSFHSARICMQQNFASTKSSIS